MTGNAGKSGSGGRQVDLIDTHCHIDVADFSSDYREVLQRARQASVVGYVVPAVIQAGWDRLLQVCHQESGCVPALGLHPMYLEYHRRPHLEDLAVRLAAGNICAIGEIGLDYWIEGLNRNHQQELFEAQLRLAAQTGLPVILHARKAYDHVLATLRRLRFSQGGIVHAFSGSQQQAEQFIGFGFKLGICGTISYERARRVRQVAATVPLDALVLETDAPDIPPRMHSKERNSPEYIPEILESLASVRGESMEVVAAATTSNARCVLNL